MLQIPAAWRPLLCDVCAGAWFSELSERVQAAYRGGVVYPPREQLFACFEATAPERVRVVILGQDPYHGENQANGLAFSVAPGTALPPSLKNIFRELEADCQISRPKTGDLRGWSRQGVLLLNTVLTVEQGKANSHREFGWQRFTDGVIDALGTLPQPMAFVLWGAQAQKKRAAIERSPYPRLILQSAHPSPLSAYRGFFGSRPFSQINEFLRAHGQTPIDWAGGEI